MCIHSKKRKEGEGRREEGEGRRRKQRKEEGKETADLFSLCRKTFIGSNKRRPQDKRCKCGLERKVGRQETGTEQIIK